MHRNVLTPVGLLKAGGFRVPILQNCAGNLAFLTNRDRVCPPGLLPLAFLWGICRLWEQQVDFGEREELHLAHFKLGPDWKQQQLGVLVSISNTRWWLIFDKLSAKSLNAHDGSSAGTSLNWWWTFSDSRAVPSKAQAVSSHLNIYECCSPATFHYHSDCLTRGSQSSPHVWLEALHFSGVGISACPAATRVTSVMEKNRRPKTSLSSSQSSEECDGWCFQGYQD